MRDLYEILQPLASQPECASCNLCERNVGLVYLLGDEAARIRAIDQKLVSITSKNVEYLNRKDGGWCACYSASANTCGIYNDRPLCCRLYPLDLMEIGQEVWWVIHSECPIGQRFQRQRQMDLLAAVTLALERHLGDERLQQWILQDRTSREIEAFHYDQLNVTKIRRLSSPNAWGH
jgi:Fe-S-cluster containining protein